MQFAIHLDDAALGAYQRHLELMSERAVNAEPLMDRIADDIQARERLLFASAGAGEWQALSPDWAARKAASGRSPRILAYTGTLERSLTIPHEKYALRVTGPAEMVVGTLDPVAHLHEFGTKARFARTRKGSELRKPKFSGALPARPVMAITPLDVSRWSGYASEWLGGSSVRVGL